MSSEPRNDTLLKVATFIAIIAVIVGGSLYMGSVVSPEPSTSGPALRTGNIEPVPTDLHVPVELRGRATDPAAKNPRVPTDAPAKADDSSGGAGPGGVVAPGLPGITDLARSPVVRPDEEKDAAKGLLASELDNIDRCYRDADPGRSATAFVKFRVTDGKAAGLTIQVDGLGEPSVDACIRMIAAGLDVSELSEGTSVYWPITLDQKLGASL
ncbi:MAG: hypothetical protein GY898_12230 [Proteobacteria bacterium]|nr:hypothetical protein [Pseudomonadota bacterium]